MTDFLGAFRALAPAVSFEHCHPLPTMGSLLILFVFFVNSYVYQCQKSVAQQMAVATVKAIRIANACGNGRV